MATPAVSLDTIAHWLGKSLVPNVDPVDLTDIDLIRDVVRELCPRGNAPAWWKELDKTYEQADLLKYEEASAIWVRILAYALSEHEDQLKLVEEFQGLDEEIQEELMPAISPHVRIRKNLLPDSPDTDDSDGPDVGELQNQVKALSSEVEKYKRQSVAAHEIRNAEYEASATSFDLQQTLEREQEQKKLLEKRNACYGELETEYNRMKDKLELLSSVEQDCATWKNKAEKYLSAVENMSAEREKFQAAEEKIKDLQVELSANMDKISKLQYQVDHLGSYKDKANDLAMKCEDQQRIIAQKEAQLREVEALLEEERRVSEGRKTELQRKVTETDNFELSAGVPTDDLSELKEKIVQLEDENRRLEANIPKIDISVELETMTHRKDALESRWQAAENRNTTLMQELDQTLTELERVTKALEDTRDELERISNREAQTTNRVLELEETLAQNAEMDHKAEAAEKTKMYEEFREVCAYQKKNFEEDLRRMEANHREALEKATGRNGVKDIHSKTELETTVSTLRHELQEANENIMDVSEVSKMKIELHEESMSHLQEKLKRKDEEREKWLLECTSLKEDVARLEVEMHSTRRKLEEVTAAGQTRREQLERLLVEEQERCQRAEALCKVQEDKSSKTREKLHCMSKYNESVAMRDREQQDWKEKYDAVKGQYEMLSKIYEDTKLQIGESKDPTAAYLQRRVNELENERREMLLGTAAQLRKLTTPTKESPAPVRPPALEGGAQRREESKSKSPRRTSSTKKRIKSNENIFLSTPPTPNMENTPNPVRNSTRPSILKKNCDVDIPIAEHLIDGPTPPPKTEVLKELQNVEYSDCNQQ